MSSVNPNSSLVIHAKDGIYQLGPANKEGIRSVRIRDMPLHFSRCILEGSSDINSCCDGAEHEDLIIGNCLVLRPITGNKRNDPFWCSLAIESVKEW